MHIAAMLVLLHGPEEQRLSFACLCPSFPDILLLLFVLDEMLAFVLDDQNAPIVKLGEEIGVKRARGCRQPEHPDHIAHPSLHLRVLLDLSRAFLFLPAVTLSAQPVAA